MNDGTPVERSRDGDGPAVSIVVAAYGRREKTLACVRSILAQDVAAAGGPTRLAIELVFVDDGSPDGTAEAVEAVVDRAPFATQVLRNTRNLGANASRNRGVRAARGELIAFLDSDCIADADWIRRLVAPFCDPTVGAASGLVDDLPATNVWELAFRGTHRLPRPGDVSRLVIGNLCVRRALLTAHALDELRPTRIDPATGRPDLTVSGRSDEEGLNLALRAAGWRVIAAPDARALHDHPYTRRTLLRQAWFGGRSAAELVWKYRLGPRKDLGPILAAHVLLALGGIVWLLRDGLLGGTEIATALLIAGTLAALLACAAISYNELRNKGKTLRELSYAAGALTLYYEIRAAGYAWRRIELLGAQCAGRAPFARVDPRELASTLPQPGLPNTKATPGAAV